MVHGTRYTVHGTPYMVPCRILQVDCSAHQRPPMDEVTNDSKATVPVLYWYGNYPTLTESQVSDILDSGSAPALNQLLKYRM